MDEGPPTSGSQVPAPEASPPPAPPAPTPRRPFRSTPVVVVVAAVVVTLLLSAVLLGVFTGGSSSGSSGTALPFSSADQVASAFAAAHGTWSLIEALGLALFNGTYLPINDSSEASNCTITTLVGSVHENVTVPEFRGNLTSGVAPVWLFVFTNPTLGGELALVEVGGSLVLAIQGSPGCLSASVSHGIPTPIADSSQAVSAAAAAGGEEFLRAHPTGVSLTMLLFGGFSFVNVSFAPSWLISWTTCSSSLGLPGSGPSTGYTFSATVNATTGVVVPNSTENTTCGSSPPPSEGIGGALTVGPVTLFVGSGTGGTVTSQGCTSGDYCYSVPIEAATNVTPADFTLSVQNSSGNLSVVPVGFAILTSAGGVIVSSNGPIESQWTNGVGTSATPLSAGMTITVDMGTQNPGTGHYSLLFTGEGPYVNSGLGIGL